MKTRKSYSKKIKNLNRNELNRIKFKKKGGRKLMAKKSDSKLKAAIMRYDNSSDILSIDKTNSKIHHSIGDDILILDFDKNNNIVGLEILDFSCLFDIPNNKIDNIKDLRVRISHKKEERKIFIRIDIKFNNNPTKLVLPVESEGINVNMNSNFKAALV